MTTSDFIQLLDESPDALLTFRVPGGRAVPYGYHITEIMNVQINSVDCGGRADAYSRQVVQLWNGSGASEQLTAGKARSIFKRVHAVRPLLVDSEIFFEWGDDRTQTATWSVERVEVEDGTVRVDLQVRQPVCKPSLEIASACCGSATERSVSTKACC
ncbi:MAG: hypothetical protein KDD65_13330 [Bacteroidetes bacterium]|nr:hypothetical protein [Bacteroidota bacterium]